VFECTNPHAICNTVAAGQVIARLKFTVWGKPGSPAESAGAFRKIMIFTVAYTFISFLIFVVEVANASMVDEPTPFIFALMVIRRLMHYVFLALLVFITWNLRANVRSKYAIPEDESCNTGCEDLLCAVCCNHLSIAQLLRHTTDYETYNATCCTETGVPPHVPSIV
jgi:Cys-rich protein (TIGR01571 family)